MARSLNRAQLIGNLTRDPELRYTPQGTAVCSFGIATNRSWTTDAGEKKDEAEFHRIVAWNKLAELCSQFLVKGRKVFVEGRLSTRSWTAQDGTQKQSTEIIISDMILLDSSGRRTSETEEAEEKMEVKTEEKEEKKSARPARLAQSEPAQDKKSGKKKENESQEESEVSPDDIPF